MVNQMKTKLTGRIVDERRAIMDKALKDEIIFETAKVLDLGIQLLPLEETVLKKTVKPQIK